MGLLWIKDPLFTWAVITFIFVYSSFLYVCMYILTHEYECVCVHMPEVRG